MDLTQAVPAPTSRDRAHIQLIDGTILYGLPATDRGPWPPPATTGGPGPPARLPTICHSASTFFERHPKSLSAPVAMPSASGGKFTGSGGWEGLQLTEQRKLLLHPRRDFCLTCPCRSQLTSEEAGCLRGDIWSGCGRETGYVSEIAPVCELTGLTNSSSNQWRRLGFGVHQSSNISDTWLSSPPSNSRPSCGSLIFSSFFRSGSDSDAPPPSGRLNDGGAGLSVWDETKLLERPFYKHEEERCSGSEEEEEQEEEEDDLSEFDGMTLEEILTVFLETVRETTDAMDKILDMGTAEGTSFSSL
ncbi:hypothetical protein M406DRAFT_68736 [Cryphonectria parasitica EP155]|uniref:Uncharacterized protein n=1 Tax=Cryphonectria parasitica (strain ATCC 38755 / EP155) TaxID=660469 RepID=A0A9P4Y4H3_CRYP1|nr:uncharacterized protein M406DRAFT_68736 [Cryphonectria parasitica EP155]KAF3766388.1 hypothetical protein M406DRAFT_68736 [Cryphonectria parasitica EP155]